MRRPLLAIALLAIALTATACASAAPGWTYAPPTPAPARTPAPSGAASGAPAEPTPVPNGPSASAGTGGGGTAVEVSAVKVAYEQTEITAPAGAPFVIHFVNKDTGIPHNVEIKDSSAMSMFKGDIITGAAEVTYQVPALAAGTYQFVCSVHPNMVGTLKVGG